MLVITSEELMKLVRQTTPEHETKESNGNERRNEVIELDEEGGRIDENWYSERI